MSRDEFEKIWRLLQTLWPNAAAKKGNNAKIIWQRALSAYDMTDVSDRIMSYAKGNKFFPDVADVTKGLQTERENAEEINAAILHNAKLLAKILHVDAPDVSTAAEAMDWFHRLEGSA